MRYLKTGAGLVNVRFIILIEPERNGRHRIVYQMGGSVDSSTAEIADVERLTGSSEMS